MPASQSNGPFQTNSESLILFETAPAATFLHRRPLPCRSSYHSLTGDHLPAPADSSSYQFCPSSYQPWTGDLPVAAITKQLPVLHQRPPSWTSDHFPAPADTSDYQPWTSDRPPALAITFLHRQISAATNSARATTGLEPATTFLHQQIPATTSPGPATTFLHQQIRPKPVTIFLYQRKPVMHQRPSIQRIPVLYQLSRPAPVTTSCSNDHHPSAAIVRRTLFRFTIRHNKVWPFEAKPLFCHSFLVRCQSLIFQKFAGAGLQQLYYYMYLSNVLIVYGFISSFLTVYLMLKWQ